MTIFSCYKHDTFDGQIDHCPEISVFNLFFIEFVYTELIICLYANRVDVTSILKTYFEVLVEECLV